MMRVSQVQGKAQLVEVHVAELHAIVQALHGGPPLPSEEAGQLAGGVRTEGRLHLYDLSP